MISQVTSFDTAQGLRISDSNSNSNSDFDSHSVSDSILQEISSLSFRRSFNKSEKTHTYTQKQEQHFFSKFLLVQSWTGELMTFASSSSDLGLCCLVIHTFDWMGLEAFGNFHMFHSTVHRKFYTLIQNLFTCLRHRQFDPPTICFVTQSCVLFLFLFSMSLGACYS